jgi:hypothetical protein
MGYPDGNREANDQISDVAADDIHTCLLCRYLNMFKYKMYPGPDLVKDKMNVFNILKTAAILGRLVSWTG